MAYVIGHPEVKAEGTNGTGKMFEGKRALVTGASSGIGFGIADMLLKRGAKEVWICSQNEQRIKEAYEKLSSQFSGVHYAAVNVANYDEVKNYIDEMAKGGDIDFVFANAGISINAAFDECPKEKFENVMNVNFWGCYNADKAVIDYMLKQGHGYVCNVSSMEGYMPNGYHTSYCSSKFAVMGLTQALRYEYADRNIKFSVICPGPVISNIWGRNEKGEVFKDAKAPDGALTENQAGEEILAGMEEDRDIIIITDTARICWQKLHEKPDSADRWLVKYTARNKKIIENIKATGHR